MDCFLIKKKSWKNQVGDWGGGGGVLENDPAYYLCFDAL